MRKLFAVLLLAGCASFNSGVTQFPPEPFGALVNAIPMSCGVTVEMYDTDNDAANSYEVIALRAEGFVFAYGVYETGENGKLKYILVKDPQGKVTTLLYDQVKEVTPCDLWQAVKRTTA
jgi:hypothetical protein